MYDNGEDAPLTIVYSYILSNKTWTFVLASKDRQQEAERELRYLTLFSIYCLHINILYIMKNNIIVHLSVLLL